MAERVCAGDSALAGVLAGNIRALVDVRRETDRRRPLEERIADTITRFIGSMRFVCIHAVLFGV